jgi:uncharacterized protein (TIGR03000 family)
MSHLRHFAWAVALGAVLLITPASQAQRHGGGGHGGHGGGHVSAAHYGGAHYGGAHYGGAVYHNYGHAGSYGHGYYGNGYYGHNYYHNHGFYGGYLWPWLWGGGVYTGYYPYSYSYPTYYDYPYNGYYNDYVPYQTYVPNYNYNDVAPANAVAASTAQIEVLVPRADAQVWFNGSLTSTQGTRRDFDTPALQPGSNYSYTVRASWNEGGRMVTEECTVPVVGGARQLVDFNVNPPQVRPMQ